MKSRIIYLSVAITLVSVSLALLVQPAIRHINLDASRPDLATLVPTSFGSWQELPLQSVILPAEMPEEKGVTTLYRTYANELGQQVTLVIVHGAPRGDTMRLHLPEICYVAQGFTVSDRYQTAIRHDGQQIDAVSMIAESRLGQQTVTYWIRTADTYVRSQFGQQLFFLQSREATRRDSALVRVSVTSDDIQFARGITRDFLRQFLYHMPDETKPYLLASPDGDA